MQHATENITYLMEENNAFGRLFDTTIQQKNGGNLFLFSPPEPGGGGGVRNPDPCAHITYSSSDG